MRTFHRSRAALLSFVATLLLVGLVRADAPASARRRARSWLSLCGPHKCPHKRTLIGTTGWWLGSTIRSNRSEPMTRDNATAADCSRCRGHRTATLIFALGPADERSPTGVNRTGVSPGQRGFEWSGAGSNRRPSAFQKVCRFRRHRVSINQSAQLERIHPGSQADAPILTLAP